MHTDQEGVTLALPTGTTIQLPARELRPFNGGRFVTDPGALVEKGQTLAVAIVTGGGRQRVTLDLPGQEDRADDPLRGITLAWSARLSAEIGAARRDLEAARNAERNRRRRHHRAQDQPHS
ncbi:MAG: hypothetical protein LBR33_00835 [Propionibacteriaceae bacterium]|nr:hypothetical protein [Propionibacteriaceae bacterium]